MITSVDFTMNSSDGLFHNRFLLLFRSRINNHKVLTPAMKMNVFPPSPSYTHSKFVLYLYTV